MKQFYDTFTETTMYEYSLRLPEHLRRQYAAIECQKLGWGGFTYIMRILCISQQTLQRGLKELQTPSLLSDIPVGKQRRTGGGRKKK